MPVLARVASRTTETERYGRTVLKLHFPKDDLIVVVAPLPVGTFAAFSSLVNLMAEIASGAYDSVCQFHGAPLTKALTKSVILWIPTLPAQTPRSRLRRPHSIKVALCLTNSALITDPYCCGLLCCPFPSLLPSPHGVTSFQRS